MSSASKRSNKKPTKTAPTAAVAPVVEPAATTIEQSTLDTTTPPPATSTGSDTDAATDSKNDQTNTHVKAAAATAESTTTATRPPTARAKKAPKSAAAAGDWNATITPMLYTKGTVTAFIGSGASTASGDGSDDDGESNLCVIEYYTSWCGACRDFKSLYQQLSTRYDAVRFGACLIEEKGPAGVTAYPTFEIYENGTKKHTLVGANGPQLEKLLSTIAPPAKKGRGGKKSAARRRA